MSRLRDGYLTTNKYYGVLIAYTVPVRESVMNVLQALDGSEQESYRTVNRQRVSVQLLCRTSPAPLKSFI